MAIVGSRHADHVDEAVAALDVQLGDDDLDEIDRIMAGAVPVAGPSPESA